MSQTTIFDQPGIRYTATRRGREFWDFHQSNPAVYRALVRLARQARQQGKIKIGIRMLWEVMRWEFWLQTDDNVSDFKLNNNYISRYARLIMEREPDLAGCFEIRELKS